MANDYQFYRIFRNAFWVFVIFFVVAAELIYFHWLEMDQYNIWKSGNGVAKEVDQGWWSDERKGVWILGATMGLLLYLQAYVRARAFRS